MRMGLLAFLFLSTSLVYGISETNREALRALKVAYKEYRRLKKSKKAKITVDHDANEFWNDIPCPHCPGLTSMAREVNEIVKKINDKKTNEGNPRLLLEIEKLEALYYLTDSASSDPKCRKVQLNFDEYEDIDFNSPDIHLLFTDNIPLEDVQAFHYRGKKSKFYVYRGRHEEKNKIVVIRALEDGSAKVSYYYIGELPAAEMTIQQSDDVVLSQDAIVPMEKEIKLKGYLGEIGSGDSKLRYGVGVETGSYNIPKNIILLEGQGTYAIGEEHQLKATVEVSSRRQMATASFGNQDREYFRANLDNKGEATVTLPFEFKFSEARSFEMSNTTNLNTSANTFQAKFTERLSESSSLSVMTTSNYDKETGEKRGVWLHYGLQF